MEPIDMPPGGVMKVDAAFRGGWAGLGIDGDRQFVAAEVVRCPGSDEAERLAVLRAMEIGERAGFRRSLIWTDSEGAVKRTEAEAAARGFSVECRERERVRNAHIAARQVLNAWEAGRMDRPTWAQGEQGETA